MALDFQQIRDQVKKLGERAPGREKHLLNLRQQAKELLAEHATRQEPLRHKVARAASLNAHLRCAVPTADPLTASFPLPAMPDNATILAADGSQINPDRHAAMNYCLVNVGAVEMQLGSHQAPLTTVQSQLYYDESLYTPNGLLSDSEVALIRDRREREALAELAGGKSGPIITLTDGPVELWGDERNPAFPSQFQHYLNALGRLHKLGAITAGYVDKPRADLVVRLLEIASLPDDQLEQAGRQRHLLGVTDIDLFGGALGPGERSPLFAIQSRSSDKYQDELALHFFYLNVGRHENPWLVRVELPRWVVDDQALVQHLHAVLVHQCRIMGNEPYPYILHRAHETAVVTRIEKEQVEQMIALELRRRGVSVGRQSPKQFHKDAASQS